MRREFIYLHRSVRSFPISRKRLWLALCMAFLMCLAVCFWGSLLLNAHVQLSGFILRLSGVPGQGSNTIEIFPFLQHVKALVLEGPSDQNGLRNLALPLVFSLTGLVIIHSRISLSRTFVTCLIIMLCATAAKLLFNPSFRLTSAEFEQIWLRGEFLVWILLPWISALIFILTIPSLFRGLAWGLLLQIYAVFWSAVRLAFCLGVFHYSGVLFLPLLWFCLGILFDLVYLLAFYSFALRLTMKHGMGERAS
jgi:hypothetical protein